MQFIYFSAQIYLVKSNFFSANYKIKFEIWPKKWNLPRKFWNFIKKKNFTNLYSLNGSRAIISNVTKMCRSALTFKIRVEWQKETNVYNRFPIFHNNCTHIFRIMRNTYQAHSNIETKTMCLLLEKFSGWVVYDLYFLKT